MAENAVPETANRVPNGAFAAKVDSAGRIKLPVKFQEYLAKLPDRSMFATWNGDVMAKIYVNGFWDRTKEILAGAGEDAEVAEAFLRVSNYYGADVDVDSNGRVTLPMELRGKMQFKDSPVQLQFSGDVLQIYHADQLLSQLPADEAKLKAERGALARLKVK